MEATTLPTVEERIAQDLAPFDAVEAQIGRYREQYQGLKINGPADKDGYKMVHAAWQELRNARLSAEKLHKELKADALKFGKACDARLAQIKDGIKPMEDDFYAQWKAEDTRKEREAEEARERAEQERKAKVEARESALYSLGMGWNGSAFAHRLQGVGAVSRAQVDGLDDAPFAELIDSLTAEVSEANRVAAEAEHARAEAERKAKEEAERIEAQRKEQEAKDRELKEREDRLNRQVETARENELIALGARPIEHPAIPFHAYSDAEWASEIEAAKMVVEARIAEEKAEAERREKEAKEHAEREAKERKEREQRIAAEAAQNERDRIEAERQRKAEEDAERIRQAGDAGYLEAMAAHLEAMPWPAELKSASAKHTLRLVREKVTACVDQLNGTISKDIAA